MHLAADVFFACDEVLTVAQSHDPLRENNRLVRLLRELAKVVENTFGGDWPESQLHSAKHALILAMGVLQARPVQESDREEARRILSRVAAHEASKIIAEAFALEGPECDSTTEAGV